MKNGEYKITDKRQMKTLLSLSGTYCGNRFPFAYQYMFNRTAKKIRNKSDYDEDIIAPI